MNYRVSGYLTDYLFRLKQKKLVNNCTNELEFYPIKNKFKKAHAPHPFSSFLLFTKNQFKSTDFLADVNLNEMPCTSNV